MTITYDQAMQTLKSMFAGAEQSVLAAVLDQNRGHMERTIDMLLQMNIPQTKPDDSASQASPAPGPSLQAPASPKAVKPPTSPGRVAAPPASQQIVGGKPVRQKRDFTQGIPEDFLRPPSYFRKNRKDNTMDEDALLAKLLQDQLFMEDLRRNPEAYFGNNRHGRQRPLPAGPSNIPDQYQHPNPQLHPAPQAHPPAQAQAPASPAAGAVPAPVPAVAPAGDAHGEFHDPSLEQKDTSFKEKFARLGEAAKEKLRKISEAFSKSNTKEAKPNKEADYMILPSLDDADGGREHPHFSLDDDNHPSIELQDRRKKRSDEPDL